MGIQQSKQTRGQQQENRLQHGVEGHKARAFQTDEKADWDAVVARVRARELALYSKKQQLFDAANKAYTRGDGAEAKRLSVAAHKTDREYRKEREKASLAIFRLRNDGLPKTKLDLHGQYVEEALAFTKSRLKELKRDRGSNRDTKLLIVTGAGHHSKDGRAKIRPAVERLLRKEGSVHEEEGSGAFLVHTETKNQRKGFMWHVLRFFGLCN